MFLDPQLRNRMLLPMIAAPMFTVSGPDLVVACCETGVVGAFPTAHTRSLEELESWLEDIDSRLAVARELDPDRLADVASMRHAERAIEAGCDGLILLSAGAGGQTGWADPFAFVPHFREIFDGIVVLPGGVIDAQGLKAAKALGCDLAYMGTRFIATQESLASAAYEQMLVDVKMDDLVLPSAFGIHLETNWLGPSLEAEGFDLEEIRDPTTRIPSEVYATHYSKLRSAGHSAGGVLDVPPAGELIRRLVAEYENLSN